LYQYFETISFVMAKINESTGDINNLKKWFSELPQRAGNLTFNFYLDSFRRQGFLDDKLEPWAARKPEKNKGRRKDKGRKKKEGQKPKHTDTRRRAAQVFALSSFGKCNFVHQRFGLCPNPQ
jgi:hypothetical protein